MAKEFQNDFTNSLKKKLSKENISSKESKILVIYTGGTIGMIQSKNGYVPGTNIFANALRQNPRFHDPVEHEQRLLSPNYPEDFFITPESFYKKRVLYKLIELTPLIDSSCMNMTDWLKIGEVIETNYYDYDGFLVLHGTDTMAYTASILSFILENLQKPVILTGSQVPYFEVRTDAAKNLLEALTIAGHFHIPEVCLYFNDTLLRGNRATKFDNSGFDSFRSPNCRYLVKSGIAYKVHWDTIRHPRVEGRFTVHKVLEENISILNLFPIITLDTINSATQAPTKAVVMLTYGSGSIPKNRPELIQALKDAADRGVILLNITQCDIGGTSTDVQSAQLMAETGIIQGSDMTLESAICKLSYLLGKYPNHPKTVKELLKQNIRGEVTVLEEDISFSYSLQNILESVGTSLGLYSNAEKVKIFTKCLTMITHNAAYDRQLDELKKLSEENVSMENKDHEGRTLMHIACSTGNTKLVEFLLSANVAINPVDLSGSTPLFLALEKDFIQISERLIERGGEIRSRPEVISFILREAACAGNVQKVKLFNLAGVNLNVYDYQGRTIAHAAVTRGQREVIAYLKTCSNFNWECKDILGFTPLSLAEEMGFDEIAELIRLNSDH